MENQDENTGQTTQQLISINDAATILNISSRGLYRLIAAGKAPAPVKLGRSSRFVLSELKEFIEQLKAKRPKY